MKDFVICPYTESLFIKVTCYFAPVGKLVRLAISMTDALDTLKSYISTNWNASNAGSRTPIFDVRHNKKQLTIAAKDYVTLNYSGKILKGRNAWGYQTVDKKASVQIDVWTAYSDSQSQLMRDEVERLMMNLRSSPATNGGWEVIEPPAIDDFRDSFRRVFRWALTFELFNASSGITT